MENKGTVKTYHGPERRAHRRYRVDVKVREMIPGRQEFSPVTLGYGGINCFAERLPKFVDAKTIHTARSATNSQQHYLPRLDSSAR